MLAPGIECARERSYGDSLRSQGSVHGAHAQRVPVGLLGAGKVALWLKQWAHSSDFWITMWRIVPPFGSKKSGAFFRLVSPHVANPLLIRMDLMCNRNELIPIDHAHLSFLLPNLASRSSSRPFRTSSWETSTSGETRHMAFEHWCASRTRTSSQRPSECHDMNIILNIGWR